MLVDDKSITGQMPVTDHNRGSGEWTGDRAGVTKRLIA
jgi:hypothetical protein